jgi:hypothetical protein
VTLAAMLGHSKINMVVRYAHPTARHQAEDMQRLETWVDSQRAWWCAAAPRHTFGIEQTFRDLAL